MEHLVCWLAVGLHNILLQDSVISYKLYHKNISKNRWVHLQLVSQQASALLEEITCERLYDTNCIWSYTVQTSHLGQAAEVYSILHNPVFSPILNSFSLTWLTDHISQQPGTFFCSGASCDFCCLSRCWAMRRLRRKPLKPWSNRHVISASSMADAILPE